MPKVKREDIETRLLKAEGHLMTVKGLCRSTGYKSEKSAKAWATGITQYRINGRIRYDTHEVAKRIMEATT